MAAAVRALVVFAFAFGLALLLAFAFGLVLLLAFGLALVLLLAFGLALALLLALALAFVAEGAGSKVVARARSAGGGGVVNRRCVVGVGVVPGTFSWLS